MVRITKICGEKPTNEKLYLFARILKILTLTKS